MEPLDTNAEQATTAATAAAAAAESVSLLGSAVSTNGVIAGATADPSTTATREATRDESAISREPKAIKDGGRCNVAGAVEDDMEVEIVSPAQVEKQPTSGNGPDASELTELSVDTEVLGNKLGDNVEHSATKADKESDEGTTPVNVSKESVESESAVTAASEHLGSGAAENQIIEKADETSQSLNSGSAGQLIQVAKKTRIIAYKSLHSDRMLMSRKLHASKSADSYHAAHAEAFHEKRESASLDNVEDEKVNVEDEKANSTPPSFGTKRIHAFKSIISTTPPFRSYAATSAEGSQRRKRVAVKSVISGLPEPEYETNQGTDDDGDVAMVRPIKNNAAIAAITLPKKKIASKKVNQKHNASVPKKKTAIKTVIKTKVPKPAAKTFPSSKPKKVPAVELSCGIPDEPLEGGWPAGWMKRVFERGSGATKGGHDRYWYSPVTNKKFRSMVEIKRFMRCLRDCGGDENMAWKLFKAKV